MILAATLLLLAAQSKDSGDAPFEELARRWLARYEVKEEDARREGWNALAERCFAHFDAGPFDVDVPAAELRDAQSVARVSEAVQALLDTENGWLQWAAGKPATPCKLDEVLRWVRGWSPKTFAGRGPADGDLARFGGDGVSRAWASWRKEVESGAWLGLEEIPRARIVLFPHRAEFVEFVALAGWLDADLRASAWGAGLGTWMEYGPREWRFVALEYSSSAQDYKKGEAVNARNPAAVRELVAQVASRALLARAAKVELDPALASALANSLVIDLYAELDTRIDGDVRARSSQGRSIFVPGGNPNGGFLPPTRADNRWRLSKGADHFLAILTAVLKESARASGDKLERLGTFELQSDDEKQKLRVHAPFLGPGGTPPDAAVAADYLELVRCYGVAFLHWLRSREAGTDDASGKRFAGFLRALVARASVEQLPALFQEIYGQPLSASEPGALFDPPTLEGRFLTWLAKR